MRHSPHYHPNPLDDALFDDDKHADDGIPSADEDDEEELLVAHPVVFKRALWTRRTAIEASLCLAAWCLSSAFFAFMPRMAAPFFATAICMAALWLGSFAGLKLLAMPMLRFDCPWPFYLSWIGLAGALTALDVCACLWSMVSCPPSEVVLGRAAAPLLQFTIGWMMRLQRQVRIQLLCAAIATGVGLTLVAFGEAPSTSPQQS